MRALFALGAFTVGLGLASPALAYPAEATSDLNCRKEPDTSAEIVGRIERSQIVNVLETMVTWHKIDGSPHCWASGDYLVTRGPESGWRITSPRLPTRSAPARLASRPTTSSRRSVRSAGYCPCSGPNVCIGPRGGRYCITSGGNKRYGV